MNWRPAADPARVAGLILTVLANLAGCRPAPRPSGDAPARTVVRMALERTFLAYGPLLLAQSEGFFAEEGLDVEFLPVDKADEALPALIAGEIDVLPGVLYPGLLTAIAQGARVRIVAEKGYLPREGCTSSAVVVREGIPPDEAHRRVRRIVVSRAGPSRYLATASLQTVGVDLEALETVVLPPPVLGQALRDGSVDAAVLNEPWLSRFQGDYAVWLPVQIALPDEQVGILLYGQRLLEWDREAGLRFMRAFRRGIARYNEGKTERNLETLARETRQERAVIEASCWPGMRADGRVHLPSIMAFQEWALARGFVTVRNPPERLWDPSFLDATDSAAATPGARR